MRKYFSWENFDTAFIKAILYSENTKKNLHPKYETDNKDLLIPRINALCKKPDAHFVRCYKNEIADYFFKDSPHLISLMQALEKKKYRGAHVSDMDQMLQDFKQLRKTSTVIDLVLKELKRHGSRRELDDDYSSLFTSPKTIDLQASIPDAMSMRPYQEDAVSSLKEYFLDENCPAGILAMPTGSGKTRVATNFLLKDMVSAGWQVIWLTHRAMLIEQTADSFYTFSGSVLKKAAPEKDTFKMVCVSGKHATIRATEANDDLMIFSVQSLVRNLPFLQAVVRSKVIIVVDEAHHTVAPSYRLIINEIKRLSSEVKLLGLTATPERLREEDTAHLLKIFNNKIVYSISPNTLIADGTLATPQHEDVNTNIAFDTQITLDEKKYIKKWGELGPDTLERMAQIEERNTLIVETYMKKKEFYGKTLIFALNATHCISLCEALQARGVKCDYIYCAHPGNDEKIARFKNGELDVLVNINVMTEGNDVPDIQSVFLTRPTSSDVLLMQMVGRGMRGVSSGGTETVNIVDFHDNWGSIARFLSARNLLEVENPEENLSDEAPAYSKRRPSEMVPWEMIRDLLEGISSSIVEGMDYTAAATLPVGWYDVIDEDGNDTKVLVFNSQLSGYKAMWKNCRKILRDESYTGSMALRDYFCDFGLNPTSEDLQMIFNLYRLSGEFPHLHHFAHRNKVDAAILAENIKNENIGIADINNRIQEVYDANSEIIDSLYGNFDEYKNRVLTFLLYPDGIKPLGMKIEEVPEEELVFDPAPYYDLNELVQEVVSEMFTDYGRIPPVVWTKRPLQEYFGEYSWDEGWDLIKINSVLNSKSVKKEAIKYVIYHELLHRDNRTHDKAFKALEHLYPDWTELERYLDFTFPKFNVKYAL